MLQVLAVDQTHVSFVHRTSVVSVLASMGTRLYLLHRYYSLSPKETYCSLPHEETGCSLPPEETSCSLPPEEACCSLPPEEACCSLPPEEACFSLPPEETLLLSYCLWTWGGLCHPSYSSRPF
ncbi:hypothetical protein Tco_1158865 [Tanacetum coccineum]